MDSCNGINKSASAASTTAVAAAGATGKPTTTEKKDSKTEDLVDKLIKSLGNGSTPEQKILLLANNVVELNSRQAAFKQSEKVFDSVKREKDNLQKEYNKCILMKDKLEQVCREQQKLMKSIKNESTTRIREEEEKRKQTQAHFQQSINEIFATLNLNNEENTKLKEANLEMTKKFKYLAEQYELREQQLGKINEQITLESKLNEAKIAKAKMESTIEKEILLKEKEAVLSDLLSTKQSIAEMAEREKILKEQLNMYTEKYADFQTSLKKSNDVFSTYKNEIEKMSKRCKTLEKESYDWRVKYEKSNRALLDMVGDKQAQDAYVAKSARQIAQLQKLCRTLQAERASFIEVLTANNIERPVLPELPPAPTDIEPPPKNVDKLDIMSRNCMELKKSLAQLQGQMNALAVEKPDSTAKKDESTVAKKAKNKKPSKKGSKERMVGNIVETVPTDDKVKTSNDIESDAVTENQEESEALDTSAPSVVAPETLNSEPQPTEILNSDVVQHSESEPNTPEPQLPTPTTDSAVELETISSENPA